jgi:succinoglycan biosynthesis protein ExoM
MLISVCICTYKRPGMVDTLASVAAQVLPAGFQIEIVVVDNDQARSAEAVVRAWIADTRVPVKYAVEPTKNIALARNRAISLANGELLAFIDDDEVADSDWLKALVSGARKYRADVVLGRVEALYPPKTPAWFVAADPLSKIWGPSGMFCATGSSANALLDRAVVRASGVRFDKAFGRTGGEDTDFFDRLHAMGAKIVVANDAVVRERVSSDRIAYAYLRRRAVRAGQSYGIIRLRGLTPAGRIGFLATAVLKVLAFFAGATVLLIVTRKAALKLGIRSWLNFGKIRACMGQPLPNMY